MKAIPRDETAVEWFMEEMKKKLTENQHKSGWQTCNLLWLYSKLGEEMGELGSILNDIALPTTAKIGPLGIHVRKMIVDEIVSECADIANMAMMIADVTRSVE